MEKFEEHKKIFLVVRDILRTSSDEVDKKAYRIAWKKPYNFYTSIENALETLRKEAKTT